MSVPPCAVITSNDDLYYEMRKNYIVIGRNISGSSYFNVDIVLDDYNISRKHLELMQLDGKLYMKVLSKNGIFINEELQLFTKNPIPVPPRCYLRFPSTKIILTVQLTAYASYTNEKNMSSFAVKNTILSQSKPTNMSPDTSAIDMDSISKSFEKGSANKKPPYSYAQMIIQALDHSPMRRLTLNAIYAYISENFPYYKMKDKGWQNSVRHNLSLNRYFVRVPRTQMDPGKGSLWRIDPGCEAQMVVNAYKKRHSNKLADSDVLLNDACTTNRNSLKSVSSSQEVQNGCNESLRHNSVYKPHKRRELSDSFSELDEVSSSQNNPSKLCKYPSDVISEGLN